MLYPIELGVLLLFGLIVLILQSPGCGSTVVGKNAGMGFGPWAKDGLAWEGFARSRFDVGFLVLPVGDGAGGDGDVHVFQDAGAGTGRGTVGNDGFERVFQFVGRLDQLKSVTQTARTRIDFKYQWPILRNMDRPRSKPWRAST